MNRWVEYPEIYPSEGPWWVGKQIVLSRPFSGGTWFARKLTGSHRSCLPEQKMAENLPRVSIHLNPCHAEQIHMPRPLLTFSQSDYLIQIVDINSHTKWQTVQIQISWLLQKPTDLDLHCLQRKGISGFSRTRVMKIAKALWWCAECCSVLTNLICPEDMFAWRHSNPKKISSELQNNKLWFYQIWASPYENVPSTLFLCIMFVEYQMENRIQYGKTKICLRA